MAVALALIGALHAREKAIRKRRLELPAKLAHLQEHGALAVDVYFVWRKAQRQRANLLPSNPLAEALQCTAEWEPRLRVHLEDPKCRWARTT